MSSVIMNRTIFISARHRSRKTKFFFSARGDLFLFSTSFQSKNEKRKKKSNKEEDFWRFRDYVRERHHSRLIIQAVAHTTSRKTFSPTV